MVLLDKVWSSRCSKSMEACASASNKLMGSRWAAASKFWCSYSYEVVLSDDLGGHGGWWAQKKSQSTKDGELGFFCCFLVF